MTDFIRRDSRKAVQKWAAQRAEACGRVGISPRQFPDVFAGLLERYHAGGFAREWEAEPRRLVQEQAAVTAEGLGTLPYSITDFLEQHTGRRFSGDTKIGFYPSSFSRPQHAYGFSERGAKVVVCKVGESGRGGADTAFHELLHPLLSGWEKDARVKPLLAQLAGLPLARAESEPLRTSDNFPKGWAEELLVHATANFLCVKAGLFAEVDARRQALQQLRGCAP